MAIQAELFVGATEHRLTEIQHLKQHLGMEKRVWETALKSVISG
jgi:hypothetical protein